MASALMSGCHNLPQDGPSARQIGETAIPNGDYAVIDLDYAVSRLIENNPPRVLNSLAGADSQAPIDVIGEGDVLTVWVYYAGAGGAPGGGTQNAGVGDERALVPTLTVDRNGEVAAPFVGPVRVAGLTPTEASEAMRRALVGKVIDPQVVVSIAVNMANSVTVLGEVRTGGRFPLSANSDRLLDVLALAGGSTRSPADVELTLVRAGRQASTTMQAVLEDAAENVRLAPRDQIRLTHKPRKFSTFGALARSSQVDIEDETLSLAGALSRMGGLDSNRADATSVLVFRFERPEVAQALNVSTPPADKGVPVIYRLNLRDPAGYFVANTFQVQADDLIYVPRAGAAELRVFLDLVAVITRTAYDIRVTEAIR